MIDTLFSKQSSGTISFIKWSALLFMILDHVGVAFFNEPIVLRSFGRMALLLFSYVLVHNYLFFTSSQKNFIQRLWLFGLLSQPSFMLLFPGHINIFLEFAVALSFLYFIEKAMNKYTSKFNQIIPYMLTFTMLILLPFYHLGYGVPLFLLIVFTWISFKNPDYFPFWMLFVMMLNLTSAHLIWVIAPIFTIPFLVISIYYTSQFNLIHNTFTKWLFYFLYPLHFFVLVFMQYLIIVLS